MEQGNANGGDSMMMMGQDGMGGIGGQSLDEIVNQNAKAIRRQSMPQQYGSTPSNMDDIRRMSIMGYDTGSASGSMTGFHYDPNANMDHSGMMSGNATPAQHQHHHQRNQSRRQSQGALELNTNFTNNPQGYSTMMPPSSAYASPAHPQSSFDMTMDSPYIDPAIGMRMEYNVEQNMGNAGRSDMSQMSIYNQPQFDQSIISSPIPRTGSQGTPLSGRGPSQDPGGGSGMNTSYSSQTSRSESTIHASRRQSLNIQDVTSPVRSGGVTPMSQPPSAPPQDHANSGFQGQPQNPQPGSQQDRKIGNANGTFNGVNGPIPLSTTSYNPNNQGFGWENPAGGWPSTMAGKPHTQTPHKNAYSSTGFDMLGVLVCISLFFATLRTQLT